MDFKEKESLLDRLQEEIQGSFAIFPLSKRQQLEFEDIKDNVRKYRAQIDSYNLELKKLLVVGKRNENNTIELTHYKNVLRDHKAVLMGFGHKQRDISNRLDKMELLSLNHAAFEEKTMQDLMDEKQREEKDIINHGLTVQKKSQKALEHTLSVIGATREIGIDVNSKLSANIDQVSAMYDKLEEVQSSFKRSKRVMNRIGRKIASDRYVWIFILLLFLGVVFIIVWKYVKPSASSNPPSSSTSTAGSLEQMVSNAMLRQIQQKIRNETQMISF
jgi:hypothetical protein